VLIDAQGTAKIYKNVQLVASGQVPLPSGGTRSSNYLGRSNYTGYDPFAGRLDEVAFFDRMLTREEIYQQSRH
jgi:hypothetical protein